MVSFTRSSKMTLITLSVIVLVLFSGCMGIGGSEKTPTENNSTNNSTLDIKAGPDGGSTEDSGTDTSNSTTTTEVNSTESSESNNDGDGGVGEFISGLLDGDEEGGNTTIDENKTKVDFTRNYEDNVTVILTSAGQADHIYVVDSNHNRMYSTMDGTPSYSGAGISNDQFLLSGESGTAGTTVTVDVSGSGTVRVVSVTNGQKQTISRYDYDTDSESG